MIVLILRLTGDINVAERTSCLFRDQGSSEAASAWRRPSGRLGHHQRRRMESARTDAENGSDAAGRRLTRTGYPELGVARIWKPCGVLADAGSPGPARD